MYDCVEMSMSGDLEAKNNILHMKMLDFKIDLDTRGANRMSPKRNAMNVTANEYREFLQDFSFTLGETKKWLNEVAFRGDRVKLPFRSDEFQTTVDFGSQKMHVYIEVEDKLYRYLEENLWDDNSWIS